MSRRVLLTSALLSLSLLAPLSQAQPVGGVSVDVSPNPLLAGHSARVFGRAGCIIQVDFGDGQSERANGPTWSTRHVYANAGTYRIRAFDVGTACAPPRQASVTLVVNAAATPRPSPSPTPAASPTPKPSPTPPAQSLRVTPTPASAAVARGQAASVALRFQFAGSPGLDAVLTSDEGRFVVDGEVVERDPTPVEARVQNGQGAATEQRTLPVAVIERALAKNSNRFSYVRTFTGGGFTLPATVGFSIGTDASADFAITRMALDFGDGRVEATIPRNAKRRARVELRYQGSGLLRGRWAVDGRVLAEVSRTLAFGGQASFESPELPAFDTGGHVVRFVIDSPAPAFPLPQATYYVTPDEGVRPLSLKTPAAHATLAAGGLTFDWIGVDGAATYQVRFFRKAGEPAFFSAWTKTPGYAVPPAALAKFQAEGPFLWQVSAHAEDGARLAESEPREAALGK
jgi:hypothetical protein